MMTAKQIDAEIRRIDRANRRKNLTPEQHAELQGAAQALIWVLGGDAMAPAKAALYPTSEARPDGN